MRGPIAWPNRWTGEPAPVRRPPHGSELFDVAVSGAVARVRRHAPDAVGRVTIGIEDVPPSEAGWAINRVPLAAAIEATSEHGPRIVLYRRPLEHRAMSSRGLRILVHRTLVEQLSALTGRSVSDLDPTGDADGDDD